MRSKTFFQLLILFFLAVSSAWSQELPSLMHFDPKDYSGENQNWAIDQSAEKLIYVANNKGLLEYNGAYWRRYPSPNETIVRSVLVVKERIYTGSYMDFGYWKKNDVQNLEYTSISKKFAVDMLDDEEFWNIISIDELMVFQSLKRIYIYNLKTESIQTIKSDSEITKMFKIGQDIYFQRYGKGIFRISNATDVLVLDDEVVKDNRVINIFKTGQDLLILTQQNGFYIYSNNTLKKSNFSSDEILTQVSAYDGIRLRNNGFAIGTIANGLVILNENGVVVSRIDREQGLSNNTVLTVFEDSGSNMWLGLDNGISYLNTNSGYKTYNENKGVLGSTYTSIIQNGNLYLGTNQGLFYKKLKGEDEFKFINGTQGQVWKLIDIKGELFCGHTAGTFIINGNQATKISDIPGTWSLAEIDRNDDLLLQGNYDGLYVLERSDDSWKLRNKIEGFDNSSRYFEILNNEIFVSHEYKGIFRIKIDSLYRDVKKISIDTTLKGSNSCLVKYDGNIIYAYRDGIFKYDESNRKFSKDTVLSKMYLPGNYESGKLVVDKKYNILWAFTKSNLTYVTQTGLTDDQKIKSIPLTKQVREGIVGYENITSFGNENKYLLGTTSGYIIIDLNVPKTKDFEVNIGNVQLLNSKNKKVKNYQDKNIEGNFSSKQNNIEISYYTPEFNEHVKTQYQFKLIGIYDEWSEWSENSLASFENLPYGSYLFEVRSRIGEILSNNKDTYKFEISKPWYISNTLVSIYIITVFILLIITHLLYKKHYKNQQEKLIIKNKREFKFLEIKKDREIVKLKNQKLKSDFKDKSKELAASLMSIAKKNDLLRSIIDSLKGKSGEDSLKSVIAMINKSLQENDDWEFFQEAFNNADSDFLKNIKSLYPNLTPSDLKLCAYLRLNLSTKEIAKLLNITARSVEIKRYRLRKKLDLKHKDNLVNFILEL